jgi:hypothetical protein
VSVRDFNGCNHICLAAAHDAKLNPVLLIDRCHFDAVLPLGLVPLAINPMLIAARGEARRVNGQNLGKVLIFRPFLWRGETFPL